MKKFEVFETVEYGALKILFLTEVVKIPREYVHVEGKLDYKLQFKSPDVIKEISTEEELPALFDFFGIKMVQFGKENPITLAAIISFLKDEGRLVRDDPLFQYIADETQQNLDDFLPQVEEGILVWYVFRGLDGGKFKRVEYPLK